MNNPIILERGDLVKINNPEREFYGKRGVISEIRGCQYYLEYLDGIPRDNGYSASELLVLEPAKEATA